MQIRIRWTSLGLWLIAGCIAALSCSLIRPATHIGDNYFPMGHDSFYHAARILEAVRDPAAFYEFDPKIHAPEGSLLVWPWGYDYFIAKLIRAGMALGVSSDPLTLMSWIPVGAVFIGIALLMLVARRLSLSDWTVALAALCMALNQTTQLLYGYGQIDHHYAEHLFILASLAIGLGWFRAPSTSSGIALGAVFALALAVHNALFILQVPFLAAVLAFWLQGKNPPTRPTLAFAGALIAVSLAVLIPSQPFREGYFEFYTLSWFHLYTVVCTSAIVVVLPRVAPTHRNILILAAIGAALLLPLAKQISHAQSFVSGSLGMLVDIMEMRSPLKVMAEGDSVTGFYSWLIFLAPATILLCALRCWRERGEARLLFWIWCVFGLVLLFTQLRMHYFGGFALYLPWLVVAQEYANRHLEQRRRTLLIVSLLLVLAYVPVIRHALIQPVPRAGDPWFDHLYPVFAPLREACAEDPGVVLADNNAGHYIRYFTSCSVISNNLLLTKQHFDKVTEVTRLLSLSPEKLHREAPYVKYLLVRASNIAPKADGRFSYSFHRDASTMPEALMLSSAEPPPGFKLLFKANIKVQGKTIQEVPYARLYKLEPTASKRAVTPSGTSANDVAE